MADALAYARHWRRPAELATLRPLAAVATLAAPLAQSGAPLADDAAPTRAWLAAVTGPDRASGAARRRRALTPARLRPALRAAVLGGAGVADRGAARTGEGSSRLRDLNCVAEAAMRGARELDRLLAAGAPDRRIAGEARSRLPAAAPSALQEPLVTGRLLAGRTPGRKVIPQNRRPVATRTRLLHCIIMIPDATAAA